MPSNIEWTDETWNFVRGCEVISPGCKNCFAMRMAGHPRLGGPGKKYEGLTVLKSGRAVWNGKHAADLDDLAKPLHWRKPRTVFVESMSDLFFKGVPDEWIAAAFGVMGLAAQHTYQVLTKRIGRARRLLNSLTVDDIVDATWRLLGIDDEAACGLANYLNGWSRWRGLPDDGNPLDGTVKRWPGLPNVWLGVSAESQRYADERIPDLLATPAGARFVSYEPALGPIAFGRHGASWLRTYRRGEIMQGGGECQVEQPTRLDWVIYGAESGPGARPDDLAWPRSMVEQCRAAGVAAFVKQLVIDGKLVKDLDAFPEDLRVREWPR